MTSLEGRFKAKVDRSGEHHLWTGSKRKDGAGQLKVGGRTVTAQRVAWELAHGPLPPGADVLACPDDKSCVRLNHLSLKGHKTAAPRGRAAHGAGSKVEIRPGVWKLTVTAGRYADGRRRREYRTVEVDSEVEASRELAAFIVEVDSAPPPETTTDRDIMVNEAIERYLEEHLRGEKGRSERTIRNYRQVHRQWFAPEIGECRVRDVDEATMDKLFGQMRRAGVTRGRMNTAISLYRPFFRWAKQRRIVRRSPVADFDLPTSKRVTRRRVPPEVDQLCTLLAGALEFTPDVAPLLTLAAVTGMRRGELVVVRRSKLHPNRRELLVDEAADVKGTKATKTNTERTVSLDSETVAMMQRHCERMDERARLHGVEIPKSAFLFSLEPDCSRPMPADYATRQVAELKDHLGIADKKPDTIAREDEALRLFRQSATRAPGRRGPVPKGGLSYDEIGQRLGRSEKWAMLAVASAQRREAAANRGEVEYFDGSILGLRKFTSSELMDSGFNISAVAERQGHGPQVLMKHYSKARRSADRRAADHLGRLVHGNDLPPDHADTTLSL